MPGLRLAGVLDVGVAPGGAALGEQLRGLGLRAARARRRGALREPLQRPGADSVQLPGLHVHRLRGRPVGGRQLGHADVHGVLRIRPGSLSAGEPGAGRVHRDVHD